MTRPSAPPTSVTSFSVNLLGALVALGTLFVLRAEHATGPRAVVVACVAGILPILALDVLVLRVHRRASTGLDWDRAPDVDVRRCLTKLLGLAGTLAPIALAYWVFPEYGDWYRPFWEVLRRFGLALGAFAVLYVALVDGQMLDPRDAYWQLGRVLLLHPEDARRADLAGHARSWLVKAFYLPLFVVYTQGQIGGVLGFDLAGAHASNLRAYHFVDETIFALDVMYATVGYVLSLRILDTHVRSAEPTMLGWVVALECYMPFWGRISSPLYLRYDGVGFEAWFAGHDALRWAWAGAILALEGIYVLATFAFGLRFSNLTHRGILTNGPYRFTKHPAYVAKNLSWWLITLPFVPHHGWVDAIKSSLALLGVNVVYFLRAKTEERHLSRDPTYVAYALWMNEHGLLRFLRRVPFLRYVAPPE
ncbi:MAG TPA: isoprenylcysteine carboxylmethyltransferase family protein [Polyangiaceae bacterium]|jgi:protein-S-isoprenylcysteine O-methyltransferase Ste14